MGCGIVALLLVLVAGCGLASLYNQLPAGEYPDVDFKSAEISEARSAIVPELEAQLEGMEYRYGTTRVGDRIRIDRCEPGFDNFEGRTQFAYGCRMAIVELIPVGEPFRTEAARLGEALIEGDCPDATDTDRALAEPFDTPRQLDGSRGDCVSGFSRSGPEIRDWVSTTPGAEEVELTEHVLRPSCFHEFCEVSPIDLATAAAEAPEDAGWLAVVQASESYYLVAWECDWPASWFNEICRNESYSRALAFRTPGL